MDRFIIINNKTNKSIAALHSKKECKDYLNKYHPSIRREYQFRAVKNNHDLKLYAYALIDSKQFEEAELVFKELDEKQLTKKD